MKKSKSSITRRREVKKKPVIRAGSKSQQSQRKPVPEDPAEREVKETISALKVIAFLLGVAMLGIIVFVGIAMSGVGGSAPRKAPPVVVDDDDYDPRVPTKSASNPVGKPATVDKTKDVTFRDEGSHVIMNGKRYEIVTPVGFQNDIRNYIGKAVAMKGTLTNSDEYRGPYADSEKSHCAFKISSGSGGSMVLYFGRASGERLHEKISKKGSGIAAHVVVKLPKSRHKPGVGEVAAEISKYRPVD
jgi:hypothetical protein